MSLDRGKALFLELETRDKASVAARKAGIGIICEEIDETTQLPAIIFYIDENTSLSFFNKHGADSYWRIPLIER